MDTPSSTDSGASTVVSNTPSGGETVATPPSTSSKPARNASWGGVVGILLIVAVIILGAFYTWGERIAVQEAQRVTTDQSEQIP